MRRCFRVAFVDWVVFHLRMRDPPYLFCMFDALHLMDSALIRVSPSLCAGLVIQRFVAPALRPDRERGFKSRPRDFFFLVSGSML